MCGQEQAFKKWATDVFHVSRLKNMLTPKVFIFKLRDLLLFYGKAFVFSSNVCPQNNIKITAKSMQTVKMFNDKMCMVRESQ